MLLRIRGGWAKREGMEALACKIIWVGDSPEVQLRRAIAEEIVRKGDGDGISGTAAGTLLGTYPLWTKWKAGGKAGAKRTVQELVQADPRFTMEPGARAGEKVVKLAPGNRDVVLTAFQLLHAAVNAAWWV